MNSYPLLYLATYSPTIVGSNDTLVCLYQSVSTHFCTWPHTLRLLLGSQSQLSAYISQLTLLNDPGDA